MSSTDGFSQLKVPNSDLKMSNIGRNKTYSGADSRAGSAPKIVSFQDEMQKPVMIKASTAQMYPAKTSPSKMDSHAKSNMKGSETDSSGVVE